MGAGGTVLSKVLRLALQRAKPDELWSANDLARMAGVSQRAVERMIGTGKLAPDVVTERGPKRPPARRFLTSTAIRWVAENKQTGDDDE